MKTTLYLLLSALLLYFIWRAITPPDMIEMFKTQKPKFTQIVKLLADSPNIYYINKQGEIRGKSNEILTATPNSVALVNQLNLIPCFAVNKDGPIIRFSPSRRTRNQIIYSITPEPQAIPLESNWGYVEQP